MGIIPARAGFTRQTPGPADGMRDHPRSRGVYVAAACTWEVSTGSSPLARGLHLVVHAVRQHVRIIPARAGFTGRRVRLSPGERDHPRSRGVYPPPTGRIRILTGSSPLARGLRRAAGQRPHPRGIIPARAGFTARGRSQPRGRSDHPRSRGVYLGGGCEHGRTEGSSPLARGLLGHVLPLADEVRIIPARAGFTSRVRDSGRDSGDHPRSRGVYGIWWRARAIRIGSSPLARGLPSESQTPEHHPRIIPARAGFTVRCGGDRG